MNLRICPFLTIVSKIIAVGRKRTFFLSHDLPTDIFMTLMGGIQYCEKDMTLCGGAPDSQTTISCAFSVCVLRLQSMGKYVEKKTICC